MNPDVCMYVWCIHIYNPDPVHVCMMHVSMMRFFCYQLTYLRTRHHICMMYVWCRNVWCLLACLHDACTHDACTHGACTHDACTMHIAMIYLDPDACGYDAHVRNADECMYTCMMRKSMMLIFFVTDQRTNQQWMMHACIYRSVSFVCMMHVSIIFDLWP